MPVKNSKPLRCRWGFHKWLYIGWPYHPFYETFAEFWRGCMLCHKDQRPYHTPQCVHRGEGALLFQFDWVDVPNMREKWAWKQFQHPTGWTDEWIDIPFEGLTSLRGCSEQAIQVIIHSVDDIGPIMTG